MRLFGKRKKGRPASENALGMRIGKVLQWQQIRFSGYLNRKTAYWNRASKLIALILFCLLFGGCCGLLLIKAIIHFNK